MSGADLYQSDPRDYALKMVEDGTVSAHAMLLAVLVTMSHDDVRHALDANELSPRFSDEEEDDEEEGDDEDEDEDEGDDWIR